MSVLMFVALVKIKLRTRKEAKKGKKAYAAANPRASVVVHKVGSEAWFREKFEDEVREFEERSDNVLQILQQLASLVTSTVLTSFYNPLLCDSLRSPLLASLAVERRPRLHGERQAREAVR